MNITDIVNQILKIKRNKEFVLVAICGAADTGKSTMAKNICDELRLNNLKSDLISTDSFMIDRVERNERKISGYNFISLRQEELSFFINEIGHGGSMNYYQYDNKIGRTVNEFRVIKEIEVLIVEGIHSFNDKIRAQIDLKIFITGNNDTLRSLRYHANKTKRGFSETEATIRLDKELNEYNQFIEPQKIHSDIILNVDDKYNYR